MILSTEISAKVLDAMNSVLLSNNGYADIGNNEEVAEALRTAGFVVICSKNLHGRPTFQGVHQASPSRAKG